MEGNRNEEQEKGAEIRAILSFRDRSKYQMEAELYKEGYQEFSEEAGVYEKLCEKFAEAGYTVEEADNKEDFTIHSAEEARRAIIWGEILQRKY